MKAFKSFLSRINWAKVRAVLHTATPAIMAALVAWGVLTGDQADLWSVLVFAVLSPALAAKFTDSAARTAWYRVLVGVQGVLVGSGIVTDQQVTPAVAIVTAILGAAAMVYHQDPAAAGPAQPGPTA